MPLKLKHCFVTRRQPPLEEDVSAYNLMFGNIFLIIGGYISFKILWINSCKGREDETELTFTNIRFDNILEGISIIQWFADFTLTTSCVVLTVVTYATTCFTSCVVDGRIKMTFVSVCVAVTLCKRNENRSKDQLEHKHS